MSVSTEMMVSKRAGGAGSTHNASATIPVPKCQSGSKRVDNGVEYGQIDGRNKVQNK